MKNNKKKTAQTLTRATHGVVGTAQIHFIVFYFHFGAFAARQNETFQCFAFAYVQLSAYTSWLFLRRTRPAVSLLPFFFKNIVHIPAKVHALTVFSPIFGFVVVVIVRHTVFYIIRNCLCCVCRQINWKMVHTDGPMLIASNRAECVYTQTHTHTP